MHNPDQWGIVQFGGRGEGEESTFKYYASWPARQLAMQIYYAQASYLSASNSTQYTDDMKVLSKFVNIPGALDGECWAGDGFTPVINLSNAGTSYEAIIVNEGYVARVDNKRFLTAEAMQEHYSK